MSVWTCLKCTTRYAVGLLKCPHCESRDYVEGDAVADPALMPATDTSAAAAAPAPKAKAAAKPAA